MFKYFYQSLSLHWCNLSTIRTREINGTNQLLQWSTSRGLYYKNCILCKIIDNNNILICYVVLQFTIPSGGGHVQRIHYHRLGEGYRDMAKIVLAAIPPLPPVKARSLQSCAYQCIKAAYCVQISYHIHTARCFFALASNVGDDGMESFLMGEFICMDFTAKIFW